MSPTLAREKNPSSRSVTASPHTAGSQGPSPQDRYPQGLAGARTLLGAYRRGEAADPETYISSVGLVLAEYEPWVISRVTDPRIGIASNLKFLPTVAEVKAACEAEMAPVYRENARRKVDEEWRQRRAEAEVDRGNRPTYAELQAKYGGKNWGIGQTEDDAALRAKIEGDNREAFTNRCAAVEGEWEAKGLPVHRVAGIPVSPELIKLYADKLKESGPPPPLETIRTKPAEPGMKPIGEAIFQYVDGLTK